MGIISEFNALHERCEDLENQIKYYQHLIATLMVEYKRLERIKNNKKKRHYV